MNAVISSSLPPSWGLLSIPRREPGFWEMTFELKWTHKHAHIYTPVVHCTHSSSCFNRQPAPPSCENHSLHKPSRMIIICTLIQLTMTWLQQHGLHVHCIWCLNTFSVHIGAIRVVCLVTRVCVSELWTDQSYELWPLPAAIQIPPPWLSSPDQRFLMMHTT